MGRQTISIAFRRPPPVGIMRLWRVGTTTGMRITTFVTGGRRDRIYCILFTKMALMLLPSDFFLSTRSGVRETLGRVYDAGAEPSR